MSDNRGKMNEENIKSRETKSLLAKLMAAEDINVEYRNNVNTAAFNTESRTLIMPIFKDISDSTTDLFLGHEVGHALYTPQGKIEKIMERGPSYKSLVNIVEDARIEKMIQSKFPGLSRNFYDGYSELMDRNFFGLNGREVSDLNFMDRINVHFKIGTRAGVKFTDEEQVFVDRIAKLRNWDETVAVSDDLLKYCKEKDEDTESELEDGDFDFGDGEDEMASDFDPSDSGDDSESKDDDGETSDEPAEDGNSDEPTDSDSSDDIEDTNNSVGSEDEPESDSDEDDDEETHSVVNKSGGVYDGRDELVSETMDSFDDHLKELVDTETEYTYGRVPEIELDKVIIPMSKWNEMIDTYDNDLGNDMAMAKARENFLKFRSENKSLVSYLAKEFEMRKKADEHKRTKVAKTGILNPNKLHSYKFNEDLFLRSEIVTSGKNHGFIMYLDWSGSMTEDMSNTIDQLTLLALFCKKINVPFEAYAFTDRWTENDEVRWRRGYTGGSKKPEINDMGIRNSFRLLHLASSTLSTSKFQTSMMYLARLQMSFDRGGWGDYNIPSMLALGGTPLTECILSAINMVPDFQKRNKVQIVNTIFLTDGQGNGHFSIWDGEEFAPQKYRATPVIIDPVTKKHYQIGNNPSGMYRMTGNAGQLDEVCLKVLKDRTKARVIGFYIAPTKTKRSFNQAAGYGGIDWSKVSEVWEEIKKNNFIVLEDNKGYEQYIWVSSKSLNINGDDVKVESDMTKGRMKNAFIKQRLSKFGNKVMLKKLAEFVS